MSRGIDSKVRQADSVLERGERLVESEPLRESLGALGTECVLRETANEARRKVLRGIDSKAVGCRERILELLEGGVGGDGVGHVLCALWHELVPPETAKERRGAMSKGADSNAGDQAEGGALEAGEA